MSHMRDIADERNSALREVEYLRTRVAELEAKWAPAGYTVRQASDWHRLEEQNHRYREALIRIANTENRLQPAYEIAREALED